MADYIDRQAAIDAIDSLYFDTVDDHDRTKERIKRLPSAHPEQRWIPCSERLPDIGQKVLASTRKSVFTQVFKGVWDGKYKKWIWEHNSLKTIEAWIPLPEPYAERRTDGEEVH